MSRFAIRCPVSLGVLPSMSQLFQVVEVDLFDCPQPGKPMQSSGNECKSTSS